jgi:hypothetical protein
MSSAFPTSLPIGAAYVLGGVQAPRARLLAQRNLITSATRFEVDVTGWSGGDATVTRAYDPTNLFGRYAMSVADASAISERYAIGTWDNQATILGQTFCVSMWVKAVGGDTTLQLRLRHDGFDAMNASSADLTENALTFVHWVVTCDDEDWGAETSGFLDIFPAYDSGVGTDVGTVYVSRPRINRVLETLTSIPLESPRQMRFPPNQRVGSRRDMFGSLHSATKGRLVEITMPHPVVTKTQLDDIGALLNHSGPILFEPWQDSEIAFLMSSADEGWNYDHLAGKYIGYEGSLTLQGIDPIAGVPDANTYVEDVSATYVAIPRYIRAS